jgi:hypothetical protein
VSNIINSVDTIAKIKDRSIETRATARELLNAWGFSLESRKPGVAYVDEEGQPVTTLDMACLLAEIVEWGSVINLPVYDRHGPAMRKASEVVLSAENRHGKISGLVSNQKRFNFSLRINDMNVMSAHSVGAYRNFLLMTDGEWHEGFHSFEFVPDRAENQQILKIATANNTMVFEHFINPLRWTSIYGAPYLCAKLLIERLSDEQRWLKSEIKEVVSKLKLGLVAKKSDGADDRPEQVGDSKQIQVPVMQIEVDNLELSGKYAAVPRTKEALEEAQTRLSKLKRYQEQLRFQTRASEWAFWTRLKERYVGQENLIKLCEGAVSPDHVPRAGWAKDRTWVSAKRSGEKLGRLELVGEFPLRLRCWYETATVAA